MTDPMTVARGILTLISENVDEKALELAHSTLEQGYPRDAVLYALVAAQNAHAPVSNEVRQLILKEFSWPTEELADIVTQLERIPA